MLLGFVSAYEQPNADRPLFYRHADQWHTNKTGSDFHAEPDDVNLRLEVQVRNDRLLVIRNKLVSGFEHDRMRLPPHRLPDLLAIPTFGLQRHNRRGYFRFPIDGCRCNDARFARHRVRRLIGHGHRFGDGLSVLGSGWYRLIDCLGLRCQLGFLLSEENAQDPVANSICFARTGTKGNHGTKHKENKRHYSSGDSHRDNESMPRGSQRCALI